MDKYYIYAYTHSRFGYVYIGKTHNLEHRIKTHDNDKNDNISREHESLLRECAVYFFELNSSLQMDYVEKFLIDYHKPKLNIQFKGKEECKLKMALPKWKRYVRDCESVSAIENVFKPNQHTLLYPELLEQRIKDLMYNQTDEQKEVDKLKKELEHQIDLNDILKRRMKICY